MLNKSIAFALAILLISVSYTSAEVKVNGDIVVQSSSIGAKILGEIINDGSTQVTNVKIVFTFKDAQKNVIDTETAYVNGYNLPNDPFHSSTFIPSGRIAPFYCFADVDSSKIDSYSYIINYDTTSKTLVLPEPVTITGDLSIRSGSIFDYAYGEVVNTLNKNIFFVEVFYVFKNSDGKIIDMEFAYVNGSDYIIDEYLHTDTRISPGATAPFSLLCEKSVKDAASYYAIVTYHEGEEFYKYEGSDIVGVYGNITKTSSFSSVKYLCEIANNSNLDIYFTEITVISRNSEGKIIDISYSYVNGTDFNYYEDYSTDTHIAPGEKASFELYAFVNEADVSSYEYIINYQFKEMTVSVKDSTHPLKFVLGQNYPNPFNASTSIEFIVEKESFVSLSIYNISGQKVHTVAERRFQPGKYVYSWNAGDFPSGTYVYSAKTDGIVVARKMLLLK